MNVTQASPHRVLPQFGANLPDHTRVTRRGFLGAGLLALASGGKALAQDDDAYLQKRLGWLREDAADVLSITDPSLKVTYPGNVVIYGGATQRDYALSNSNLGQGDFTDRVFYDFTQPKPLCHSLQEAMDDPYIKNGWVRRDVDDVQVPVQSTRRSLYWTMDDNPLLKKGTVKRYAILISSEGNTDTDDPGLKKRQERVFKNDLALIREALVKSFKVPNNKSHIKVLNSPTRAEIQETFRKWLKPKQHQNDEVLIYYSGHGSADFHKSDFGFTQGTAVGKLYPGSGQSVSKDDLKDWLWDYASGFKEVVCFFDSCKSGAMVAKGLTQPAQPGERLRTYG
jgi:hypothetical protein